MGNFKKPHEDYFDFEVKNNLFDLKDNNGTYIWDIIRYSVYENILWNVIETFPKINRKVKILIRIEQFKNLLLEKIKYKNQSNNYYIFCSRNKINNFQFDQTSYDFYNLFKKSDDYLQETFLSLNSRYLYKSIYNFGLILNRRKKKKIEFDYDRIINLLKKKYTNLPFDKNFLIQMVSDFYSDKEYYTKIFEKKKVKKIFMTQYGIHKGIFAASKELKIPVYEFQHGVVYDGHIAYNYPKVKFNENQLYIPNKILSLSPFWFKDLNIPFVKIKSIGNNFFYNEKQQSKGEEITIITSTFIEDSLNNLLLNSIEFLKDKKINLKLHSDQFNNIKNIKEKFKKYKNIKIITDELSIKDLMKTSSTFITIHSTATYEALQANRKVIILKDNTYFYHEHIFNNKNLHLIKNESELLEALQKPINHSQDSNYFSPFDIKIAKEVYNE